MLDFSGEKKKLNETWCLCFKLMKILATFWHKYM